MVDITPTVGRVLWYGQRTYAEPHWMVDPEGQPLTALIAHVNDDDTLNLAVFNTRGEAHSLQNVRLLKDGENPEDLGLDGWAYWMPFQKDQAQRYAAREGDTQMPQNTQVPQQQVQPDPRTEGMAAQNGEDGTGDPNVRTAEDETKGE
jgi:hypothetical protein